MLLFQATGPARKPGLISIAGAATLACFFPATVLAQSGGTDPVVTLRKAAIDVDGNGSADFELEFKRTTYPRVSTYVLEESIRLVPLASNLILAAGSIPVWTPAGTSWNGTAGPGQTLRNTGLTLSQNFVSNPLNPGPSSWGSIAGLSNEQAPGPHALPVVILLAGQRRNAWIEFTAIQKSMGSFVVGPTGPIYIPGMFNLVATGMASGTAPGTPVVFSEPSAFRAFRVSLDAGKPRIEWHPLSILDERPALLSGPDPLVGPWTFLPINAVLDPDKPHLFLRLP